MEKEEEKEGKEGKEYEEDGTVALQMKSWRRDCVEVALVVMDVPCSEWNSRILWEWW